MDWSIVAIVAIVIWGVVQVAKARAGIVSDEAGNETLAAPRDDGQGEAQLAEAKREIEVLRYRVQVLERIATDRGQNLAHEIEQLRDRQLDQPTANRTLESGAQ